MKLGRRILTAAHLWALTAAVLWLLLARQQPRHATNPTTYTLGTPRGPVNYLWDAQRGGWVRVVEVDLQAGVWTNPKP
jgi:hypothetical protein